MPTFSRYQKFVIAILAFLQFTIVLDFMILSPLGAFLLRDLGIKTSQFGLLVSAYAFSAGIAGICTAGFADKFDRKKLLLFFYAGFVLGTFLCAAATGYRSLLAARIVTGLFGGVIGSISFAIITDLFPLQVRGRVMGVVQTSFAASQVMGLPLGLLLANHFGWHAPFVLIGTVSLGVGFAIVALLEPLDAHLKFPSVRNPLRHLVATVSDRRYLVTFAATMLLATGGFMLMPFGSAFTVNNLGIALGKLPVIYLVTGVCSIIAGPLLGRLADSIGKYAVFCIGSVGAIVMVGIYCNLGVTPIWIVLALNAVLFSAIMARMISASALTSAVPGPWRLHGGERLPPAAFGRRRLVGGGAHRVPDRERAPRALRRARLRGDGRDHRHHRDDVPDQPGGLAQAGARGQGRRQRARRRDRGGARLRSGMNAAGAPRLGDGWITTLLCLIRRLPGRPRAG
jgi:predicted MFS family arabinose efflux permease